MQSFHYSQLLSIGSSFSRGRTFKTIFYVLCNKGRYQLSIWFFFFFIWKRSVSVRIGRDQARSCSSHNKSPTWSEGGKRRRGEVFALLKQRIPSEVGSHSCHSCCQLYVVRGFICEETYQVWQNINLSLEVGDMHLSLEVEHVSLSLQEVGVCQLVTGGGGCVLVTGAGRGRWSPSSLANCNTGSWCDHSGTETENM